MIDRDGFGHSQEVVRSASGHVGLAAAGGGIKLKAEEAERVRYRRHQSTSETIQLNTVKCLVQDVSEIS